MKSCLECYIQTNVSRLVCLACNCGLQLYLKCLQTRAFRDLQKLWLWCYKHCFVGLLSKALSVWLCCVSCSWIISWHHPITHTPAAIWGAFRSSDSSTIKSHSLHVSVSQGISQNKQKIRLQVSFSFYIKVSLKNPCMGRLEGIWSVSAVSQLFSVGRCRW